MADWKWPSCGEFIEDYQFEQHIKNHIEWDICRGCGGCRKCGECDCYRW